MCMEDLQLGRTSASSVGQVLAPASVQVAPQSTNRTRLIFSSSNISANAYIRIWPNRAGGAAFTGGFAITPQDPMLVIEIEQYGDMLFDNWFAAITGAAGDLTIGEVIQQRQK